MKIAVTGGGGFIGARTVAAAEKAGHNAWRFDRADGNDIMGDLSDLRTADVVIHLAGVLGTSELFDGPHDAIQVNVNGTLRILQWCEDNGAGYVGITMPDSSWSNVYQATKLCAMRLATAWHRNRGVPVCHVRAFNAYGPGQKHGPGHPQKIIPTFAWHAWHGLPLPIWGSGHQTVDPVYVDDVAEMLVRATRFGNDEIFDAGTGTPMSVNLIAAFVNRMTSNQAGTEHLDMRPGEEPDSNIVAKGEGWDVLGWHPVYDPLLLRETVESYRP